jgi:hypothetical protein
MTFQEANRPGGPGLTMDDEPAQVRAAATSRELGSLIGTRHGASTRHALVVGWGIAGACLLVDLALWPVVSSEDPFIPLSSAARHGGRDPFVDRLLDGARSRNLPIA